MKLCTTCEAELWAGFFGINEYGEQPVCNTYIEVDVDDDCIETDERGVSPCFSVTCPSCGALLEWPQEW